jgi:hypothetical protein
LQSLPCDVRRVRACWHIATSLRVRRCCFEARCKMPTSRQETLGKEFDWFAIDSAGELAACSSAGWGEIPAIVLQQCTLADSPIQHIDRLIALMPEIGSHRAEGRGPGKCWEWPLLGNRGLYVYDWKHWHGPYERIIVPTVPMRADALCSEILASLRPVTVSQFAFACCRSFPGAGLGLPVV